jgi:hypothetical protein
MFTPAEQTAWEAKRKEAYLALLGSLSDQDDEIASNVRSGGDKAGPTGVNKDKDKDKDEDENGDNDEDKDLDEGADDEGNQDGVSCSSRSHARSKKFSTSDCDMETSEHELQEEEDLLPSKPTASKAKKGKQRKQPRKRVPAQAVDVGQGRWRWRADNPGSYDNQEEENMVVAQGGASKQSRIKPIPGTIKIPAWQTTSRTSSQSNGRFGQHNRQNLVNKDGLLAPKDINMGNMLIDAPMDVDFSPEAEDFDAAKEAPVLYTSRAATININMPPGGSRASAFSINAESVRPDFTPLQLTSPPPLRRRITTLSKSARAGPLSSMPALLPLSRF